MITDIIQSASYDNELVRKYSGRGPRYTSYPTAPEWNDSVGESQFRSHIRETNGDDSDAPISIYLHVPFCKERCFYCACNVIISGREDILNQYVDNIIREVEMVASDLNSKRRVVQFHIGGGTPTTLPPQTLARMLDGVMSRFTIDPKAERSVEVDLRVTVPEHLEVLRNFGFNRISTGVQDFSDATQTAINRIQGVDDTVKFANLCREQGFESFNVDLVYGLPHQTLDTFNHTLDAVCQVDPDRVALYNYAHLPAKVGHQRKIKDEWLPEAEVRFNIFKRAIQGFSEAGYDYIGMDHFAKPGDELTIAQREGTLQRNFMGFTTRAGADLYSFGVSSISSLPSIYTQNVKNLRQYSLSIEEGRLPIERGIELTRDDRIRRWTIMELMCNLKISASRFKDVWDDDFHTYFADELTRLKPFADDGLLEPDFSEEIRVVGLGQIIIRPIGMVFDHYLTQARKKNKPGPVFSKTI